MASCTAIAAVASVLLALCAGASAYPAEADMLAPPPVAPPADWAAQVAAGKLLWSPTLPEADRSPLIGNGFLAMNVMSDSLFAAGVFNGNLTHSTTSHRARIPPYAYSMSTPEAAKASSQGWALALDTAMWMTRWTTANGSSVEERWYAHQFAPFRGVLVYEVIFTTTKPDLLNVTAAQAGANSSDMSLEPFDAGFGIRAVNGSTSVPEQAGAPLVQVAMASTLPPPQALNIPAGRTMQLTFVTAVATSLNNATDPMGQALSDLANARAAAGAAQGLLRSFHTRAWAALHAAGRIEVEGDLRLAQVVNSSMYSIMSSARDDWAYGLSPGSLANNGYNGHTFWDQETWMYPPMLYLHTSLAASLVQYRVDRIKPAEAKAAAHGAKGLWYPWESAFSGIEECPCGGPPSDPGWNGGAKYEQHVNGDIALSALQYWYATGDAEWLKASGYPLLSGVADFWASRAVACAGANNTGAYCVNNVMGPDEYHGGVNNSGYTNAIAALSLQGAADAARTLGLTPPTAWEAIARALYIPFDAQRRYHPEYDGYAPPTKVKQADTVMLGYPLNLSMPADVRANDLAVYEATTDANGPAMTWAIYAIAALDVGNATGAAALFERGYATVQGNFSVWTETPHGGCTPFITGAGGFLQSVVNGYVGARYADGMLSLSPHPPPGSATAITAHGVGYLGNELRVRTNATHATVELLPPPKSLSLEMEGLVIPEPAVPAAAPAPKPLMLTVHSTGATFPLIKAGDKAEWPHGAASITPASSA